MQVRPLGTSTLVRPLTPEASQELEMPDSLSDDRKQSGWRAFSSGLKKRQTLGCLAQTTTLREQQEFRMEDLLRGTTMQTLETG